MTQSSPRFDYPRELRMASDARLRLSTVRDVDLILNWSQDPRVFAWWEGRPLSREEVEEKYVGARLPDVIVYIIERDNEPIGLVQAWHEGNQSGMDMFLSGPAQGQGLGPLVARALASDLTERGWSNITADPAVDNRRAVRAWQKAGFVVSGEMGTEDGHQTQIMVFRPS